MIQCFIKCVQMSCRICMENKPPLISPCNCKGSIKYVHKECITKWLKTSGKTTCELCKFSYRKNEGCVKVKIWFSALCFCFLYFSTLGLVYSPIVLMYFKYVNSDRLSIFGFFIQI